MKSLRKNFIVIFALSLFVSLIGVFAVCSHVFATSERLDSASNKLYFAGEWREETQNGVKVMTSSVGSLSVYFEGESVTIFLFGGENFGEVELRVDGKIISTISGANFVGVKAQKVEVKGGGNHTLTAFAKGKTSIAGVEGVITASNNEGLSYSDIWFTVVVASGITIILLVTTLILTKKSDTKEGVK